MFGKYPPRYFDDIFQTTKLSVNYRFNDTPDFPCYYSTMQGSRGKKNLLRKTLSHQKNEARAGGWLSGKVLFEAVAHTAYDQQNC